MEQSNYQLLESLCFSFESDYLNFIPSHNVKPATWIIDVFTSDDDTPLGQIKYYANWRQYVFHPEPQTIYEKKCMSQISKFLILMNDLQKRGIKPTNPQTTITSSIKYNEDLK